MIRYLIDIYRVDVPEDHRDDLTEATEDALNRTRDYYCQCQGKSLSDVVAQIAMLIDPEVTD